MDKHIHDERMDFGTVCLLLFFSVISQSRNRCVISKPSALALFL